MQMVRELKPLNCNIFISSRQTLEIFHLFLLVNIHLMTKRGFVLVIFMEFHSTVPLVTKYTYPSHLNIFCDHNGYDPTEDIQN